MSDERLSSIDKSFEQLYPQLTEEFFNQYNPKRYEKCEERRLVFIRDYPIERIPALSLEEYCHSGSHDTFCYKLEFWLHDLSSMGDMHIDGYGVYVASDGQIKVYRALVKYFGDDYKQAFEFEKKEIVKLLKAGEKEDYDTIKDSSIQQQFRSKLLSVYYPDKYFPVCTMRAAKAYCDMFSIPVVSNDTMTDLNRKLVEWKKSHMPDSWTLFETMALSDWMWNNNKSLGIPVSKEDIAKKAKELSAEIDALNLTGDTRDAVVKQRVNQGVFREKLLSYSDHCVLCQVNEQQLLVASHIKPWSASTPEERLDHDNGFLMCPNHDKVFDRGFISFTDDGRILISPELSETNRIFLNLRDDMQIRLSDGNKKYLQYHRNNIFRDTLT